MKVVLVGSGAREHALANSIARSADVVVSPGNPGMDGVSPQGHRISSSSSPPEEIEADLVVIGPEVPLVAGLADRLRHLGRAVFGPGAAGARLEGSKAFMKEVARDAGVPTADFAVFTDAGAALAYLRRQPPPYVVKTDGLAAGKGVLVTEDLERGGSRTCWRSFPAPPSAQAGRRAVIEDAALRTGGLPPRSHRRHPGRPAPRRRRTTSGYVTVTSDRTPVAWVPTPRCRLPETT